MKTLPLKFRKNGQDYYQRLRGRKACIYEQRFQGKLISYEVFRIRIQPERKIGDIDLPKREQYPPNEGFGYWAFSITSWERALKKYHELESKN